MTSDANKVLTELTPEEAREILIRYNTSHFDNPGEKARYSIPADPNRDDDLRLNRFIVQYEALRRQLAEARASAEAEHARMCMEKTARDEADAEVERYKTNTDVFTSRLCALMESFDYGKSGIGNTFSLHACIEVFEAEHNRLRAELKQRDSLLDGHPAMCCGQCNAENASLRALLAEEREKMRRDVAERAEVRAKLAGVERQRHEVKGKAASVDCMRKEVNRVRASLAAACKALEDVADNPCGVDDNGCPCCETDAAVARRGLAKARLLAAAQGEDES